MSALHAYFAHRNQQAFQRTLEGGRNQSASAVAAPGTSGGKSWTKTSTLNVAMSAPLDINARDWLGRTVLHLACAATDTAAVEYVRMTLAYPGANVNLQDKESMWTALHRALYHGNLASAILLLQRSDLDPALKDLEGYTAFDLYNSTIEHTKPTRSSDGTADLYTWGANRNATLGLGNSDDRSYPEQVGLKPIEPVQETPSLATKLVNVQIRQIFMSKLHTVVVTAERRHNVRVCGFGSGGRLGPTQHTQYSLMPILGTGSDPIVSAALGQDHTLVLTKMGEVYSWGLNRFSQLGYIVEVGTNAGSGARTEEPIQTTPKKVPGLKGQFIRGVAASKNASACWTADHVYTWGTNAGQLGYDKVAQPVQISPRIVTKVPKSVIMVAMSDNAMACLLETFDVLCFANDRHFKINFPVEAFPSGITAYKILQSVSISKITACENMFAALSTEGEVFTFCVPTNEGSAPTSVSVAEATGPKAVTTRPQRVWSLRKRFSAAKDVALSAEGGFAVCTESGHIYVRSRGIKGAATTSAKGPKFVRVPGLQRVVAVSANATGGYGALRVEYRPPPIDVVGNDVREDLASVRPWLKTKNSFGIRGLVAPERPNPAHHASLDPDEEREDELILQDITHARHICNVLRQDKKARAGQDGRGIFSSTKLAHGADIMIQVGSAFEFPAHRLVLVARSSVLRGVLSGGRAVKDKDSKISVGARPAARGGLPRLVVDGCRPMAAILLATYLYSDDIPAIWDRRVALAVETEFVELGIRPGEMKRDLHQLARLLELPRLDEALEPLVKRTPFPCLQRDMNVLFVTAGSPSAAGLPTPDVVLKLADREVQAYSLVLRARSPLFAAFFDDDDWTSRRWSPDGTITVNLAHLPWRSIEYVMRYLCCGEEEGMFENLESIQSVDDLLDLMFEVKSAANELHITRLMLVCSKVITRYITVQNAGFILNDASYLYSLALVEHLHAYMSVNMETMLENRLLDSLSADLIKQLSVFVRVRQAEKLPVSRSNKIVDNAMLWFGDWLGLQDVPEAIVPSGRSRPPRESTRTVSMQKRKSLEPVAPASSRVPSMPSALGDDVFLMDDIETLAPSGKVPEAPFKPVTKSSSTWKAVPSTPKTDLKSIMAETKTTKTPDASPTMPRTLPRQSSVSWRQPPGSESPIRATGAIQRASSGGSPWKSPEPAPVAGASTSVVSPPPLVRNKSEAYPAPGSTPSRPPASPSIRPAAPTTPGLGPVFSPSRQATSFKSETRRTSSSGGKVWSQAAPRPAVEPTPAAGLSFADIQAIQLAQTIPTEKDKRSLREIQEEEQSRQAEDDFLKWWAEEEARTKREMEGPAAVAVGGADKKKRKPRRPKEPRDPSAQQAGPSTFVAASVEASPTTPDQPGHFRKLPRQLRAQQNDGAAPRDNGQGDVGSLSSTNVSSREGSHHPRPRGSFRGRGGTPRPVPQVI